MSVLLCFVLFFVITYLILGQTVYTVSACDPGVFTFAGDMSKWLITTYLQVSNNGQPVGDNLPRTITKSSLNSASRIHMSPAHTLLACIPPCYVMFIDTRKWRNNNGLAEEPFVSL